MKISLQEMIDERHEIYLKLMAITHKSGKGKDDMKEYGKLQDQYEKLDIKIRRGRDISQGHK